ncbi:MAG: hypothetical protein LCH83_01085 [Proteobacteria bacterium]|nr:hypothetical protein [Pseudomonadota bacterium]
MNKDNERETACKKPAEFLADENEISHFVAPSICHECPLAKIKSCAWHEYHSNKHTDEYVGWDVTYSPCEKVLTLPSVIRREAIVLKTLMPSSKRYRASQFKDILNDYEGETFNHFGYYFDHLELCPWEIFNVLNPKNELVGGDIAASWIGVFLNWAEREPILINRKTHERLSLIYLVIAIKFPHLINHIVK